MGDSMNRVIRVSLDDLGCILISTELRSRLGMAPGMTLIVEKRENDGVRLRPRPVTPELVEKEGVLVVRAEPLSDLTATRWRTRR